MVSSASVFSISCTSKPGKEKGSIGEKKNLISGDNLSSTLLFFFLYEPDAQWLSTKSGEEPVSWYHHSWKRHITSLHIRHTCSDAFHCNTNYSLLSSLENNKSYKKIWVIL